jgi:antitoxin component YwqK of YwqJK toxin-antitoxin module
MKKDKQKIKFMILLTFCYLLCSAQNPVNSYDSNGLRHGEWKGYYENSKNLRYEGKFNHGKETGTFTYYVDNDKNIVMATRKFDNFNNAFTIFYDEKKFKVSEGKVINKLREGIWTYYHKNSKAVMTIENYVNDKLEGIRKVFYIDGTIAEEVNYKNDLKDGVSKKYSKKGKMIENSIYSKGLLEGAYKVYDESGEVVINGQFKNDLKRGMWNYYEKGKLVKQINTDTIKGLIKPKPRKKIE